MGAGIGTAAAGGALSILQMGGWLLAILGSWSVLLEQCAKGIVLGTAEGALLNMFVDVVVQAVIDATDPVVSISSTIMARLWTTSFVV